MEFRSIVGTASRRAVLLETGQGLSFPVPYLFSAFGTQKSASYRFNAFLEIGTIIGLIQVFVKVARM